ncbi:MAG: hypothetical protein KKE44_20700 [Proteobacteria bacterium]|nr:hypothetical protein [Pseudomonadota bacterium]MBU1585151.1 hypothetical protein [Pseudomonadota bacterium]MBU2454464.1 hypothetical protein [Pseudomonadota bacterium]MBU2629277.1 hypothetical protein [Pseudomonadota bacterium]
MGIELLKPKRLVNTVVKHKPFLNRNLTIDIEILNKLRRYKNDGVSRTKALWSSALNNIINLLKGTAFDSTLPLDLARITEAPTGTITKCYQFFSIGHAAAG